MIVKDIPESSTDPVRQFENSNPIDSIPEDTDQLDNQCKDLIDSDKGNFSKSSFDPSSSIHSSDPILEMPSKEEETSPTCGLAAPDSKDSLEVQLYSVCDDISENLSGKEESFEDLKHSVDKQDSSQSEDEKNSIIDDKKHKPCEEVSNNEVASEKQEQYEIEEIEVQSVETSQCKIVKETVVEELDIKYAETNGDSKDDSFEIVEVDDVDEKMPVQLEHEVSSHEEIKKIVEEVKVEALNEVNTEAEKQIDEIDEASKMTEVMEIFEKIESEEVSADPVKKSEDNSYQTTVKKIETRVSEEDECVAVTAYQTTTETTFEKITTRVEEQVSVDDEDEEETTNETTKKNLYRSSSSSFEEVPRIVHQESTDSSSFSGRVEITKETSSESESVSKLDTSTVKAKQDDEDDTSVQSEAEKKDSRDSSDTEEDEQKGVESSSDYDTSSAKPQRGKRPDSFVSDTSSDYDSLSNAGSRRPQSFVIDDEYDVITEEETAEMISKREEHKSNDGETESSSDDEEFKEKKKKAAAVKDTVEPSDKDMADSSSSESEGPEEKELVRDTATAPNLGNSISDIDGISSIPNLSSSLHADPSSVSVDVAQSSVIHSNTLEEIDPLAQDGSAHPSPLTRSSDSNQQSIQGILQTSARSDHTELI